MRADILLRMVAGFAVCLAGCSSDYQVSLTITDAVNAGCDTSCVTSVSVDAYGQGDGGFQCIENVSMKSLRDNGLSGKIDLAAPEGLVGLKLIGWRDPGCQGLTIFDGVQRAKDSEVSVPVRCVASCKSLSTLQIQTTSVLAVAQGKCDSGGITSAIGGAVSASHFDVLFPKDPFAPPTVFSPLMSVPVVGGQASMPGLISTGSTGTCSGVVLFKDGAPVNSSCIRFSAPGVCGADNTKTEVAMYSAAPIADLSNGYRSIAVFAQRNGTTPIPIADAVVTVEQGSTARVEYLDLVTTTGAPELKVSAVQTKTGPSGAFAIYAREPALITVTAVGKKATRLIGGLTYFGPAADFVLGGAQILTPD